MTAARPALLPTGSTTPVERRPVLCGLCGVAWDERYVTPGTVVDDPLSLCPSCLLHERHGERVPDDLAEL